jgi:hypothetical protein
MMTRAIFFFGSAVPIPFLKAAVWFSFLFRRPLLVVKLGLCLIGAAALSRVGQRAPRTSSYPDS